MLRKFLAYTVWQKTVQNDKQFCPSRSISLYDIDVIYVTHVKNDNISWPFFRFFKIVIFWLVRGVKWQKAVQSDKNYVPRALYLRNKHHMIVIYGAHV